MNLSLIVILNIILANQFESSTVLIIGILLSIFYLIPNYIFFKVFVSLGIILTVAGFAFYSPNFELNKMNEKPLFNDVHAVIDSDNLFKKDLNTTWRAVLWHRIVTERFPENIWGIGFGTPILPYAKGRDTVYTLNNDEHDAHVSGAHNTYLTLFLRLGLAGLILIFLIFNQVFQEFYGFRDYYQDSNLSLIFFSFFTIAIIGLFNLLLETPTLASIFWILLGFVTASIDKRKEAAKY